MIFVELQESEAVAKLAEYEATADINDSDHIAQARNKLKLSLINAIGEVNYYEMVNSQEYANILGVIKRRINLVNGREVAGYSTRLRQEIKKTYSDEQRHKKQLQRIWFGRGGWALRGA